MERRDCLRYEIVFVMGDKLDENLVETEPKFKKASKIAVRYILNCEERVKKTAT